MEHQSLTLYLLSPLKLPTDCTLSLDTNRKISQVLDLLLSVLDTSSIENSLKNLDQALEILGNTKQLPLAKSFTKTVLSKEKIEDYDNYFLVRHIQSDNEPITIVFSIIIALKEMLLLNKIYDFHSDYNEQLKQGYKEYIFLLKRVFNLS